MNEENNYNINERLLSPHTYNFLGDLDIMIATGKATTQDAIECAREIYDGEKWNKAKYSKIEMKKQRKQKRPLMYK